MSFNYRSLSFNWKIGNYEIPAEYKLQESQPLQITGRSDPVIETLPLRYSNSTKQSLFSLQDDEKSNNDTNNESWREFMQNVYTMGKNWFSQQENKGLKLTLIVLLGCILVMFWYLNAQFKEFQQLSQVFFISRVHLYDNMYLLFLYPPYY